MPPKIIEKPKADFGKIQPLLNNPKIKAKVVEGIDLDSDGIIDSVEFRE